MAFFGKSKTKSKSKSVSRVNSNNRSGDRVSQNRRGGLSSCIRESEPGNAHSRMKQNSRFILEDGCYAIIILDTSTIGGLGSKSRDDENKGLFLELVGRGVISAVTNADLLDANLLGIIPTDQTLEKMIEFSMLTSESTVYYWGLVDPDLIDEISLSVSAEVKFDELSDIHRGIRTVDEVVQDCLDAIGDGSLDDDEDPDDDPDYENGGYSDPDDDNEDPDEDPDNDDDDDYSTSYTFDPDDDPDYENGGYSDPDDDNEDPDNYPVPYNGDEGDSQYGAGYVNNQYGQGYADPSRDGQVVNPGYGNHVPEAYNQQVATTGYGAYPNPTAQQNVVEFDADAAQAAAIRRVLPSDLDLAIDLAPFTQAFDYAPKLVKFPEDYNGSRVLDRALSAKVHQANMMIMQMRETHRRKLVSYYVQLVQNHIRQVVQATSITSKDTYYHRLVSEAEKEYKTRKAESQRIVSSRSQSLQEEYLRKRDEYADAARQEALHRYDSINLDRFEEERSRVEINYLSLCEEIRNQQLSQVKELRKSEAERLLEYGISEIISHLTKIQDRYLEEESRLAHDWNVAIGDTLRENLSADDARVKTLARQLDESKRLEENNAEWQARVDTLTLESRNREESLTRELNNQKRRFDQTLQENIDDYSRRLSEKDATINDLRSDIDKKRQELEEANVVFANRHEQNVKFLKAQVQAKEVRIAELTNSVAQSTVVSYLGYVAVGILCAAISSGATFLFLAN